MRNILLGIFLCSSLHGVAQIEVIHTSEATGKEQGLVYTLPQTALQIQVIVSKYTYKVGQCYQYAERYLGEKSSVLADHSEWKIESIEVTPKGLPDKDNAYMILFRSTPAPTIDLTPDGIVRSINMNYPEELEERTKEVIKEEVEEDITEKDILKAMNEELLQANSVSKMAEIAAKEIYDIRETRNDLTMGRLDNMPSDGESYKLMLKQLEEREKALTALFNGRVKKEKKVAIYSVIPNKEMEKKAVFRFSKFMGLVDNEDLTGTPIYLTLKTTDKKGIPENSEIGKGKNGFYYSIPAKVEYNVFDMENNSYAKGTCSISQMGSIGCLSPNLFDKKNPLKVVFDPATGAIRQMIQ